MKEPVKIKLTDNPPNRNVKLTPLPSTSHYDIEMTDDLWIKDENNKQNNSQSISKLESESSD
jgi:hypothetical protein